MNDKNKNTIKGLIKDVKKLMRSDKFDPNGSYTGTSADGGKPIQDQDDL